MSKPELKAPAPRPAPPDHTASIARKVLAGLGAPGNLARVDVRRLWDECYRVNVLCTTTSGLMEIARITDSFFVVTSAEGEIVGSSPAIAHRYPRKSL